MTAHITVAICTKNRHLSLVRAVTSTIHAIAKVAVPVEILVIDDGRDAGSVLTDLLLAPDTTNPGLRILEKAKPYHPGLWGSRLMAVDHARGDVVLFIDDDCEIGPDFLVSLNEAFSDSGIAGVGGVDRRNLPASVSGLSSFLWTLFSLRGQSPGRLSSTGFNYSHATWPGQSDPFDSDFLHGCAMAFRRSALFGLQSHEWLSGHAACEDLVMSDHAAKSGRLIVRPDLAFVHHEERGGRGSVLTRLKKKLSGHWNFYRNRRGAKAALPVFLWSAAGCVVYLTLKPVLSRLPGSS